MSRVLVVNSGSSSVKYRLFAGGDRVAARRTVATAVGRGKCAARHIDAWLRETGERGGETLTLQQVWDLSQAWYSDRMDPGFRGRTQKEIRAIFDRLGLTSDFWK